MEIVPDVLCISAAQLSKAADIIETAIFPGRLQRYQQERHFRTAVRIAFVRKPRVPVHKHKWIR